MFFHLGNVASQIKEAAVPLAHAQDLKFNPPLIGFHPAFGVYYWQIPGEEAYKNARLREYQDMLRARGVTDMGQLRLLVAQIMQENGALTPDRIGDHGCSFGILQYNACSHNNLSAKHFLARNPQWRDYRFQLASLADEVKINLKQFGTIRCTIVWHNGPAFATPCTPWTDTPARYFHTISKLTSRFTLSI